jgi:hypothetical protein
MLKIAIFRRFEKRAVLTSRRERLRQVIVPTGNVPKEGLAERVKEQGMTTNKNFQEKLAIKTGIQPKSAKQDVTDKWGDEAKLQPQLRTRINTSAKVQSLRSETEVERHVAARSAVGGWHAPSATVRSAKRSVTTGKIKMNKVAPLLQARLPSHRTGSKLNKAGTNEHARRNPQHKPS